MSVSRRKVQSLLLIEFLFLSGMWLSKNAWPLWFTESGDMRVYGISYSVMALAGVLSISIGNFVHRLGPSRALRFGALLYAIGVGLRWFNQSLLAGIASGALGGIGASAVILCFRVSALQLQSDGVSLELIAWRKSISDIAAGAAGLLIAGLLGWLGYGAAVFSALLPLMVVFLVGPRLIALAAPAVPKIESAPPAEKHSVRELLKSQRLLALVLLSALGGLYTSLSAPYLPLIYRELKMSAESIALLGTIATLAGLGSQPLAVWITKRVPALNAFISGEVIYLGSLVALLGLSSPFWVPLLVGIRTLGRSVSLFNEEVLEVGAVSKDLAATFYGAAQTAFLIGDSVGGALGGFIVSALSVRAVLIVSIALVMIHVFGMALTFAAQRPVGPRFSPEEA